jgi:VWFA-related protein
MTRKCSFLIIHLSCIGTLLFGTIPAFSQDKAPASPIPVLKTQVRLVVLDVLVTDSHGKAIANLKPEDFTLTESGTPQTIKTLEDHTAATTGAPTGTVTPAATDKPLPPGTYTNRPKFQSNIWNVIVIDMQNTPPQEQAAAREALRTFARQLPPGAPVALLVMTSDSVKMLVPFTAGGAEISKLLQGNSLFPTRPRMLDTYNADEEFDFEKAANAAGSGGTAMKDAQRETEMGRLQIRAQQTLRSLDLLAVWLSRFPGKKNLFWLSAAFPLSAEPQTARDGLSDEQNSRWLRSFADLQHDTDARLETARVAVFPLDVRGALGSFEGIDTADVKGALYAGQGSGTVEGSGVRYSDDVNQATQRVNAEHAEMEEIAHQTGGVARYNRNDLAEQLSDQFIQAQTYYTLSYSPTNKDWNGKYRTINLKLKDHTYKLFYRRGYYADAPPPMPSNPVDAFTLAMRHGAAPSTSVLFNVRLDKNTPGKVGIHYAIDLHTLKLVDTPDNRKSAKVNCAVVEYDGTGTVLGTTTIQVAAAIRPDQMPLVEASGFPATQQVPLLPNAKWLAIGVQDANTDSFGTLQLAVDPPTPALTPASATTK